MPTITPQRMNEIKLQAENNWRNNVNNIICLFTLRDKHVGLLPAKSKQNMWFLQA